MTMEGRSLEEQESIAELLELARAMRRNLWAGAPVLRGALPKLPAVTALPTASIEYAYAQVVLIGTPDIHYTCLRNAGGTWGWRTAATG